MNERLFASAMRECVGFSQCELYCVGGCRAVSVGRPCFKWGQRALHVLRTINGPPSSSEENGEVADFVGFGIFVVLENERGHGME